MLELWDIYHKWIGTMAKYGAVVDGTRTALMGPAIWWFYDL